MLNAACGVSTSTVCPRPSRRRSRATLPEVILNCWKSGSLSSRPTSLSPAARRKARGPTCTSTLAPGAVYSSSPGARGVFTRAGDQSSAPGRQKDTSPWVYASRGGVVPGGGPSGAGAVSPPASGGGAGAAGCSGDAGGGAGSFWAPARAGSTIASSSAAHTRPEVRMAACNTARGDGLRNSRRSSDRLLVNVSRSLPPESCLFRHGPPELRLRTDAADLSPQHEHAVAAQHLRRALRARGSALGYGRDQSLRLHDRPGGRPRAAGAVQPQAPRGPARHRLSLLPHAGGDRGVRGHSPDADVHELSRPDLGR